MPRKQSDFFILKNTPGICKNGFGAILYFLRTGCIPLVIEFSLKEFYGDIPAIFCGFTPGSLEFIERKGNRFFIDGFENRKTCCF
jgi:hypothetical protein